ncbi:hypothetical protein DL96DRAFT_326092 [Flagelloscypha sp. PMI_526]|nr:hypothetical protein DL96DRAFT_326092 [Flagelloscypha sp. PMI_526]
MKFSPAFLSLLFLAVSAAPTGKVAREDANVDALYSPHSLRDGGVTLLLLPEEAREVDVDSVFFVENESWNPANDRRELTVDAGFLVTTPEHWAGADARRELTVDAGFLVVTPEHWTGVDA